MIKLSFCTLLFILSQRTYAQSNEGTNFWFGFMEHIDEGQNSMAVMITSKQNAAGVVQIPGLGFSQNFTVSPNQVEIIQMPTAAEYIGSEGVRNLGINVTTGDPVSVYIHQYHQARSEATVVLPVSSLSTDYYAMSYQGISTGFAGNGYSQFLIVATEDETEIEFTVESNTQAGKAANSTNSILMNTGQTYVVQAAEPTDDLSGSFIRANKKISVFAGASFSGVPSGCRSFDNLIEQMTPIDTWGRRFVSVPTTDGDIDVFRILASENATEYTVYGSTNNVVRNGILERGEFVEYSFPGASYIEADKPILVAQYMIGQGCTTTPDQGTGDPSIVILNSIEQIRDTVTLFNSPLENISSQFINVISRAEAVEEITMDGLKIQSELGFNFQFIGPNDEYAYVRINSTDGAHTIIDPSCGVIAIAYGFGEVESYAYSGGASFSKINANQLPEGGCLNTEVLFNSELPPERYELIWDIGDGQPIRTDDNFVHTYTSLGTYPATLTIYDKCFDETEVLNRDLLITLRDVVAVQDPYIEICEGEFFELGATDVDNGRYEWAGPLDYVSDERFPTVEDTDPSMSGFYKVVGNVSGCKTFPDSVEVVINPTPIVDIGRDSVVCTKRGMFPELNAGVFNEYLWNTGELSRNIDVMEPGEYFVDVIDDKGCMGSDSILFTQQCPTEYYIPTVFSPGSAINPDNQLFGILGEDIISVELTIFDRWGNEVFQTTSTEVHWDGTKNGTPLEQGNYVWVMNLVGYKEDATQFEETTTGTVLLIR